ICGPSTLAPTTDSSAWRIGERIGAGGRGRPSGYALNNQAAITLAASLDEDGPGRTAQNAFVNCWLGVRFLTARVVSALGPTQTSARCRRGCLAAAAAAGFLAN